MIFRLMICATCLMALAGCSGGGGGGGGEADVPTFSLAWSEYPSWSVFGVASERGLIDGAAGRQGPIEKKWGVDIELKELEYDPCLTLYGTGETDAVCMTNMDSLKPSLTRDSVAVLPTSTSVGADACIVVGIDDLEGLKGIATHGLDKSVSQYAFERNLELQNADPAEFPFVNMDPGAAATAMQTGDAKIQSIMVWNPFVLQTLRNRKEARVLFDSSTIPEEIIDMVVVGKDVLAKPGGDKFVCAVIDTFYQFNDLLADPDKGDEALVDLGAKFSNLQLDDMKIVVEQTQFYKTPDEALKLYDGDTFRNDTMPKVVDFCVSHDMVPSKPNVGFDDADAQLNFDSQYIKRVRDK